MRKNLIILILVFLFKPTFAQEQEDSQKSWGLGLVGYTSTFYWDGLGLELFYQKEKHQFGISFLDNWSYNVVELNYGFYPNEWKPKFNLRVETVLGGFRSYSYFSGNRITSYVGLGYGMRLKLLKHFFLSHSSHFNLTYYPSYDYYNNLRYRFITGFDTRISLQFNLGSLRWKRK